MDADDSVEGGRWRRREEEEDVDHNDEGEDGCDRNHNREGQQGWTPPPSLSSLADKRRAADIVPPPRRIAYVAALLSVSVDMLASCEYLSEEVGRGAGDGGRMTFERRS